MRGQYASGSYFDLLGVRAIHGRMLTPADDSEPGRGGPHGAVAVISDGFWTRRFGRDPAIREIGIRIAVGASQHTVVWMMVRETLLLVTIGAALGTLASLAATRYVAGQLFGVTPRDPVAIGVALSVLGCVTLIAGYLPARHASRIDPVRALRAE